MIEGYLHNMNGLLQRLVDIKVKEIEIQDRNSQIKWEQHQMELYEYQRRNGLSDEDMKKLFKK